MAFEIWQTIFEGKLLHFFFVMTIQDIRLQVQEDTCTLCPEANFRSSKLWITPQLFLFILDVSKSRISKKRGCSVIPSVLTAFNKMPSWIWIHNTSEHRIQEWSISMVTRLSGSGMRADVTLFQKWNVNDSSRIFLSIASCCVFSSSVAGAVKYLVIFWELIGKKMEEWSNFNSRSRTVFLSVLKNFVATLVNSSAPFHLKRVSSYVM